MDFSQFEYLLTVADLRSLNKAAQMLHVSPGALSQHITKLEQEYGTILFERKRGAWLLTEAGRVLANAYSNILSIQKDALTRINDLKSNTTGSISIGLLRGWTVQVFTSLYPRFHARYPGISITPYIQTSPEILFGIRNGIIDLAFLVEAGKTVLNKGAGYFAQILGKEQLVLAIPKMRVPPDYASENTRTMDIRELKTERFYLASPETVLRSLQDELFQQAAFQPLIASQNIENRALTELALSGICTAFILSNTVRPSQHAAFFRPLQDPSKTIWAVTREAAQMNPAIDYLVSLAKEYYEVDPLDRTSHFSS